TTSPLDPNTSLPPRGPHTPCRASSRALCNAAHQLAILAGCVPPSLDFFPFFAFLGASVFSWVPCDYFIRFRLREVWRRDCALIAACVLFASA
ncbi:hypothetical protein B0H13DRAFT_2658918, partial [Mycena leptocephala]